MLVCYDRSGCHNWATDVRVNLYSNGFGYVWEAQYVDNEHLFLTQYLQCIKDQYVQHWHASCSRNKKMCIMLITYFFKLRGILLL